MALKSSLGRSEVLKQLFKLFIKPVLNDFALSEDNKHGSVYTKKLEQFFGLDYRTIILCKAKRDFKLRGPKWATPATPYKLVVGLTGDYQVNAGEPLWVRMDDRTPDFIDVETERGVFRIDRSDWLVYREWVTELC